MCNVIQIYLIQFEACLPKAMQTNSEIIKAAAEAIYYCVNVRFDLEWTLHCSYMKYDIYCNFDGAMEQAAEICLAKGMEHLYQWVRKLFTFSFPGRWNQFFIFSNTPKSQKKTTRRWENLSFYASCEPMFHVHA